MKQKILVLTSTFPRWLNDTDPPFVYELSKRLASSFDITVHAPHYPGAKTNEIMNGIRVHRFRYFFQPLEKLAGSTGILPTLKRNKFYYLIVPFFLCAQFLSAFFLVRKICPDIIHAHWLIPQGLIACLAGGLNRVPFVVTCHGADVFGLNGVFFSIIKRFVLQKAKTVTVVSKAILDQVRVHVSDSSQIKVIPMGVSSTSFSPLKTNNDIRSKYRINGPFLLYAGRLTEKKGIRYLIEALKKVKNVYSTGKLLILGSGELEGQLKKQVADMDLQDNVHFVGPCVNEKMAAYYATADVFIGPSIQTADGDTEGFGITFVEAAMSGCPVIAADVGGIGDIIKDMETGLLVPQKDSEAIANAIIFALQNKTKMTQIAENALLSCIQKYDWSIIVNQYKDVLM